MSRRKIDLSKAVIGDPTPCSIALVELIRTMEQIDETYDKVSGAPTEEEDRLITQLEQRQDALEYQIRREIADKLHIDAVILQEAVTFV
jgi:hypothetical protein